MLINTGNISRKVLSKVLRSFDKNFERLHEYVKDEVATTSASEKDEDAARNLETKNTKAGDSESKGAEAEKQKDPDEELYWIQPYGEENQEPIVITVYKK